MNREPDLEETQNAPSAHTLTTDSGESESESDLYDTQESPVLDFITATPDEIEGLEETRESGALTFENYLYTLEPEIDALEFQAILEEFFPTNTKAVGFYLGVFLVASCSGYFERGFSAGGFKIYLDSWMQIIRLEYQKVRYNSQITYRDFYLKMFRDAIGNVTTVMSIDLSKREYSELIEQGALFDYQIKEL